MGFILWFKNQKDKREITKSRKNLRLEIDKNVADAQNSIADFTKIFLDFKKYNYTKHDSFLNLCIFSDVVSIDLSILLEKYQFAERKQEKKLFARVIAIVILDYLDNIAVLIGSQCLAELKRNDMLELMEEFKLMHKNFSIFKNKNEALLRDIRNNTIAHKNKNALILSNQINNLNEDEIYQFGLQFKIYIKEFVDLSTKVINYIADYMNEGKKI